MSAFTSAKSAIDPIDCQENRYYGKGRELEIGNATSAIVIALLKVLIDKDVLSNDEVRALLTNAAADLGAHEYTAPVKAAIGIILDDILPTFPEDGGD